MATPSTFRAYAAIALFLALVPAAQAKYSGGSGTAQDPYQIATAADLIAVGETPADYDKHFILTADIDLSPSVPGGRIFTKAPVAPHAGTFGWPFSGPPFAGVLDGDGHTIWNLTVGGIRCAGLIGQMEAGAEVKNLRLVGVNVSGSDGYSGGLVGLVGTGAGGGITNCSSVGTVRGFTYIGGLVGYGCARITRCFSGGMVYGSAWSVGGLVGYSCGHTQQCYSTAAVTGAAWVGGLVGESDSTVIECYSTGRVNGGSSGGGLIGKDYPYSQTTRCFWDMETSGQSSSAGGTKKTTAQMQTASTFLNAGWDFAGETANGTEDVWSIDEGKDYPHLSWETSHEKYGGGSGTEDDPYLIQTAEQMNDIGVHPGDWSKHFTLVADIDLSDFDGKAGRPAFNLIGPDTNPATWYYDPEAIPFTGVFDGDGHTISNLRIAGQGYLGLFCCLEVGAEVRNLGVLNASVTGSRRAIGALVGYSGGSSITCCYSTGKVSGTDTSVGGLVGYTRGGSVTCCWSKAEVTGASFSVGGLVGESWGAVTDCYSTGAVGGTGTWVGGLVGGNYGPVTRCYSTGPVNGGGLTGCAGGGSSVTDSFWDAQTSGRAESAGGIGLTTAEMQTASTFIDAGWDFVGETGNGTEDIWMMPTEGGYPLLFWQGADETGVVAVEDFETGDLTNLPWQYPGDVPWTVTSEEHHSGTYSARAGSILIDQSTSMATVLACAAGEISFWQKVSCHSTLAALDFYIDDQLIASWSGRKEWEQVSFPITAGTHTFTWTYSKVGWSSMGQDTAWIDDVVFPVP